MAMATRSRSGRPSSYRMLSQFSPAMRARTARTYASSILSTIERQCSCQKIEPRSARGCDMKPAIVAPIRRCFSSVV